MCACLGYVVIVSILSLTLPSLSIPIYAVGKTGQHMLIQCATDLEGAKYHFTKKCIRINMKAYISLHIRNSLIELPCIT